MRLFKRGDILFNRPFNPLAHSFSTFVTQPPLSNATTLWLGAASELHALSQLLEPNRLASSANVTRLVFDHILHIEKAAALSTGGSICHRCRPGQSSRNAIKQPFDSLIVLQHRSHVVLTALLILAYEATEEKPYESRNDQDWQHRPKQTFERRRGRLRSLQPRFPSSRQPKRQQKSHNSRAPFSGHASQC